MANEMKDTDYFYMACTDFINSNFILSKSKLSVIFKVIAASRNLSAFFMKAEDGFKIKKAKEACFVSSNNGKGYNKCVILPDEDVDKVAFIFYILVEISRNNIDTGKESLTFYNFLMEYFGPSDNHDNCFRNFTAQIMIPFRDIVYNYFNRVSEPTQQPSSDDAANGSPSLNNETETEGGVIKEEKDIDEGKSATEGEFLYLVEEESKALSKIGLKENELIRGVDFFAAMKETFLKGEYKITKTLLSGYKYFLLSHKYSSKRIEKIYRIIEESEGV